MLLAKVALGVGGTLLLAGAYTCREGFIRVSVDERRPHGSHVHLVVPAALLPMSAHIVPARKLEEIAREAGPWMPAVCALTKELRKFPEADLVEVRDAEQHVQIRTHGGKLLIDVVDSRETVHLVVPLAAIDDLSEELAARFPAA